MSKGETERGGAKDAASPGAAAVEAPRPARARGRPEGVSFAAAGMVLADEEAEFGTCGFCGAAPLYGTARKLQHLRNAHGMTPRTPGCEPHALVFPTWDAYEEHRRAEHAG